MKWINYIRSIALMTFFISACSSGSEEIPEPTNPEKPNQEVVNDTIALKIGFDIKKSEESLDLSRATTGSNDLIGVQIEHCASNNTTYYYACGVFDDVQKLIFKFVKGNSYIVTMNYFPNAKNIVYNYSNGTFGIPFSAKWGLQDYTLNEPVYYTGGINQEDGEILGQLLDTYVQTTESRDVRDAKRGTETRYLGSTGKISIDEDTEINVPLGLYMKGITLNVGNFTEGLLTLKVEGIGLGIWEFKPNDETSVVFQVPARFNQEGNFELPSLPDGDNISLFYKNSQNEQFLLATDFLKWNDQAINHVYTFDLAEREDGTIGIKMPDGGLNDESEQFD